jgi:transposase
MDFSQSYISAVSEYFSSSYIVFDKFHFSQYVNRVMEKIRRDIQRELPDDLKYKSKKHSRWLVLRRECNMNPGHKARLEQLKEDNAELFEAYLIKEELLSIFDVDIDTTSAEVSLHNWCKMALNSAFKPFHRLAKSINDRMHLLLHWFRTHVTNAKTEALNNVIKSLLKRAYGYKDFEYFRLKVLQRCGYLMKRLTH